jgi:hypothetical protein
MVLMAPAVMLVRGCREDLRGVMLPSAAAPSASLRAMAWADVAQALMEQPTMQQLQLA